jgi:hypothetical protein
MSRLVAPAIGLQLGPTRWGCDLRSRDQRDLIPLQLASGLSEKGRLSFEVLNAVTPASLEVARQAISPAQTWSISPLCGTGAVSLEGAPTP